MHEWLNGSRAGDVAGTALLAGSLQTISATTWNARALICAEPKAAKNRERFLKSIVMGSDIIGVQEVHGNDVSMRKIISNHQNTHIAHPSPHPNAAAGGNLLFVKKNLMGPRTSVHFEDVVPGRVNWVVISKDMQRIEVFNVHNFDISHAERRRLFDRIEAAKRQAATDPTGRNFVILMGDFNFLAPGETPTKLGQTGQVANVKLASSSDNEARRWRKPMTGLTEIFQAEFTRLGDRNEGEHHHLNASRLDRIYISLPPWALMQLRGDAKVTLPVAQCVARNLSDHAPVRMSLSCKRLLPRLLQPIPKWLARHPIFKDVLADLESKANLDAMPPVQRWERHKQIIRDASAIAAKRCLGKVAQSNDEKLQILLQTSRAIWFDIPHMIPKVLSSMPQLRECVQVDGHGHVAIINADKYHQLTSSIVNGSLDAEITENEAPGTTRPRHSRGQQLARWVKPWAPFDRKMTLFAIELPGGGLATTPVDKAKALGKHWGAVFAKKEIRTRLAEAIARLYSSPICMDMETLPGEEDFIKFWQHARHSGTGPDGIPYCAWGASGRPAARTQKLLLWDIMSSASAPPGFNDSYAVFPPKGHKREDDTLVTRSPEDTRPLNLKNCDNKSHAGVINNKLKRPAAAITHHSQRGFVKHRQGLDNVADVDTQARIVDLVSYALGIPAIVLFDYAAAFPSVAHAYLFLCLSMIKLPKGIMNFFEALCTGNRVFANIDGVVIWLFDALCGVLQGCPASGTLFVIAINPCLHLIDESIGKNDIVRAFADDIAIVIDRLGTLSQIAKIFEAFRRASNLAVKPNKCVIIPLGSPFSDEIVRKVRVFLGEHIPDWAKFAIEPRGEYLGFFIGTNIKNYVWTKAEGKWDKRSREIAAAKVAPSLGVPLYNTRAITTLGYVAQIHPPPASLLKAERSAVQRVFHFLNNTLPANLYYRLQTIGAPQPASIQALSYAARYRAAVKTITVWRQRKVELDAIRDEHAPFGWLHQRAIRSNPWWDTWPVVDLISQAAEGFGGRFGDLATLDKTTARVAGVSQATGKLVVPHSGAKRLGLQAEAHRIILPRLFSDSFPDEAIRRLLMWFPDLASCPTLVSDVTRTFKTIRKYKPFFVIGLVRTWFNGWITSYRVHTHKKNCIFGCLAEDRLLHYVECVPMWTQIYNHLGVETTVSSYRALALSAGTVGESDPDDMVALGIAVDAYQNLKDFEKPSPLQVERQLRDSWRRARMNL